MKKLPFLSLVIGLAWAAPTVFSQSQARVGHVITHQRATIVTDPSRGENGFPAWGKFPAAGEGIRSIKLLLTLGSPDSMPTAHWDYCDVISIRRKGGVNGADQKVEIGRMLTPYGSIFGKGWQWQWAVDVTDFAPLLRDSVEIEYLHTGYEPTSVGWALTLDFAITYGPPVARQLGMVALWNGKFKYGDPADPIDQTLKPVGYEAPAGTAFSRLRLQHTGHGADKPRNCSEFCSRWRQLNLDGKLVDKRDMWKECSTNPLYPQGGTWIYDRAYWCPGDLQMPDFIDVPLKPGQHLASIAMEPYTATDNIQAFEHIGSYLFNYAAPTLAHDVAIEDIIVPTDKKQHFRLNPAIAHPQIVIRNLGSKPLTSLIINYGTNGFGTNTYTWKGNLGFNQSVVVVLPGAINSNAGANTFTVTVQKPNGKKDGWDGDNSMVANFTTPRMLPQQFVVNLKTNNRPQDNFLSLVSQAGDTIWQRRPEGLKANSLYKDTINLSPGFYALQLLDTAGNGLQFWAQPQQGDGYLRLADLQDRLIHVVESDCGQGELLSFEASPNYRLDTVNVQAAFSMFPRRTSDKIELEMQLSRKADVSVKITVDAILYQQHDYKQLQKGSFSYSLGYLPKGRYVVDVYVEGIRKFTGRVNRD